MLTRLNSLVRKDQKDNIKKLVIPGKSENAVVREIIDFYFSKKKV